MSPTIRLAGLTHWRQGLLASAATKRAATGDVLMDQQKCPRCLQLLWPDDTVTVSDGRVVHLDCQRSRDLSREERVLLFRYCSDHAAAKCPECDQSFRRQQLGSDLLGHRTHLCPHCRADLTESLRGHLYACAMLPAEVRQRAREVRDVARRLVKDSRQLSDRADVLMREASRDGGATRDDAAGERADRYREAGAASPSTSP